MHRYRGFIEKGPKKIVREIREELDIVPSRFQADSDIHQLALSPAGAQVVNYAQNSHRLALRCIGGSAWD